MFILRYVVIDFETANKYMYSPCALGIAVVEDFKIIDTCYFLINPNLEFGKANILIHGIKPIHVLNAPTFDIVWNDIEHLFENSIIVAHNAFFDVSVLINSLARYKIPFSSFDYFCTYKAHLGLNENTKNDKLNTLCEYYDISLANHHNAKDDAIACANLFIKLQKQHGSKIFERFSSKDINICSSFECDQKSTLCDLSLNYSKLESVDCLKDSVVVITGDDADVARNALTCFLESKGAFIRNSVTSKTDYLIVGTQDKCFVADKVNAKSTKIIKAQELIEKGKDIKIISIKDVCTLLKGESLCS